METLELERVSSEENTMVKDSPPVTVKGLVKWMMEFRKTNYPNRPLTDHFWSVCILSREMGIDIRQVLGEDIWNHMRVVQPKEFEMTYSKPFNKLSLRTHRVSFHLRD